MEIEKKISELQAFFLVHSFLYYELAAAFISDKEFELRCRQLMELQKEYPQRGHFWKLTENLDKHYSAEVMGLSGGDAYPEEIRKKAYKELYDREAYLFERNNEEECLFPYSFEYWFAKSKFKNYEDKLASQ
jgi:hypothetical protein